MTGLKNNLGIILSGENVNQAGGQRLQQLQKLLPTINGTFKEYRPTGESGSRRG